MTIVIAMNTIININIIVLLPIIIKSNSTFFGRSNLLLKRTETRCYSYSIFPYRARNTLHYQKYHHNIGSTVAACLNESWGIMTSWEREKHSSTNSGNTQCSRFDRCLNKLSCMFINMLPRTTLTRWTRAEKSSSSLWRSMVPPGDQTTSPGAWTNEPVIPLRVNQETIKQNKEWNRSRSWLKTKTLLIT